MKTTKHFIKSFMVIAPLVGAGCAGSTSTHVDKMLYRANLDECYEVRLLHRSSKIQEGLRPEERYEQLLLVVTPRKMATADYPLSRVDVRSWPSWTTFVVGEAEARRDASGQRVWFVDRKNGKVIGTVDRQTGQTTGPKDPPPDWATPQGGERLDTQ